MSGVTLIRGARHWKSGEPLDLAFADGAVIEKPSRTPERVIEARGAVLAPGLVDVHVHLREPGQTTKETIASGARAAAAGGFTGVLCMPNTVPVLDDPAWIEWVAARGRAAASCRVHPIGAVTVGQRGERLTDFTALAAAGAVALSDDGRPILTAAMMRRALADSRRVGIPVIAQEDLSLRGEGHMNEGPVAAGLGILGIPSAAESVMVRRDVEMAELTGGRLHLAHLSCRASLEALRDAKRRGLAVSGETCPHYWTLSDEAVGDYDTNAKMNPPLRSADDREAVIAAIADGTVDCLATDHAPHTRDEKLQSFDRAPFGIVGLETALALTITFLVEPGRLSLARALELWTEAPRRLFGLPEVTLAPGSPADLVLLDPSSRWRIEPERFHSKGRNTPFAGWEVRGRALLTVCGGAVTHSTEEMGIDVEVGASPSAPPEEAHA